MHDRTSVLIICGPFVYLDLVPARVCGVRPVMDPAGSKASAWRQRPDSGVRLDIEVSVVGADRHDEMVQEALEPGQPEWVGPWIAEPDRRVPGELIGAIGHREADVG